MINESGEPLAEVEARKDAVERNQAEMSKVSLREQLDTANVVLLWQKQALSLVLDTLQGTANHHPQTMMRCAKYARRCADMYCKDFAVEQDQYVTLDEAMLVAVAEAKRNCAHCKGTGRFQDQSCILCELATRAIMG